MFRKNLAECSRFTAIDGTHLCELIHPLADRLDIPYSIAHAKIKPGESSLSHRLKTSTEVYIILEGEGEMHIDGEQSRVTPGQAIFIPPGAWQCIRNTETVDLKFLCIVHPMWRREDEEIREAQNYGSAGSSRGQF